MTAKEKAMELVDKYKVYVNGYVGSSMLINYEYPEQILSRAKKCAIICVEEILKHEADFHSVLDGATNYWNEVLNELKNM